MRKLIQHHSGYRAFQRIYEYKNCIHISIEKEASHTIDSLQ
ncbi:hypothetical protein HMPREF9406_1011 [Clostridium sp. HGF2]|nr:hypothetical protein HMPREF9406_1011 [Clostridium sp. HGF2]